MLNNAPIRINHASRNVVLRHPNSFDLVVYRKELEREDSELLGGAALLSDEDEYDFSYKLLGEAKLLFADSYMDSPLSSSQDVMNYAEHGFFALIECLSEELILEKGDIAYIIIGEGIAIGYEITAIPTVGGIPPYNKRFEVTKRDDLTYSGEFEIKKHT